MNELVNIHSKQWKEGLRRHLGRECIFLKDALTFNRITKLKECGAV